MIVMYIYKEIILQVERKTKGIHQRYKSHKNQYFNNF